MWGPLKRGFRDDRFTSPELEIARKESNVHTKWVRRIQTEMQRNKLETAQKLWEYFKGEVPQEPKRVAIFKLCDEVMNGSSTSVPR